MLDTNVNKIARNADLMDDLTSNRPDLLGDILFKIRIRLSRRHLS